jgi:hypothetical protein
LQSPSVSLLINLFLMDLFLFPLKWFESYLNNRMQCVQYQNSRSDFQKMTCGVPQGSVLGPLLFIIYTNDLSSCLRVTKSIQFADDTTLYASGKDHNLLFMNVNKDLEILNDWFKANKLSLNINKTNYMLFTNKRGPTNCNLVLKIGSEILIRKSYLKFLGIYIDDNLNWHEHLAAIKTKLVCSLYIIRRIKSLLPSECLKTLYYTLVYPHLTYGIMLWGSTTKSHIHKVFVMQKNLIRVISNSDYNAHTDPIFVELQVMKMSDIYALEIAKFMYNYANGNLAAPLLNIFIKTQNIHDYNTRQCVHLRPKINRLNTTLNSFLYKGPTVWNTLPTYIKESNTIKSFVLRIKTFFTICNISSHI